jgi:hypothetical protein
MPSDERLQGAHDALRAHDGAFRAAVETAYAQVRAYLAAHGSRSEERARETALELGQFAGGRIDVGRLAAVLGTTRVLDQQEEAVVQRCADVMKEALLRGDSLFVWQVPAGGDLRVTVEEALGTVGRAFGAALVYQAVKAGTYRAEVHEQALRSFPFRRWNRQERLLAPPLVVSVDGASMNAPALAEYLDGAQKIVLVIDAPCAPAPLARLITPHLFVMQCESPAELARLLAADGPAVAALVPATAAHFVHDPATARLEVTQMRAEAPRTSVGGWSAWQQGEELALLRALAAAETLAAKAMAQVNEAAADATRAPDGDAAIGVDELSAWLLAQAGFAGSAP